MSMINLEKCQAIYNGNIANVVHSAEMLNGFHVNLGDAQSPDLYEVGVPATATLGSAEVLIVFNDETSSDIRDTVEDYKIKAGVKGRAYHLTVGDVVLFDATLLEGVPAVGKYLIPANGELKLAVADDLTGNTRLAYEIVEEDVIGFDRNQAFRARVVKA